MCFLEMWIKAQVWYFGNLYLLSCRVKYQRMYTVTVLATPVNSDVKELHSIFKEIVRAKTAVLSLCYSVITGDLMRTFYSVVKQKTYISKTGEKSPSVVLQAQFLRNVTLILSCFSLSAHKGNCPCPFLTVFTKYQSQKVEKLHIRKTRTCAVLLKRKLWQHQFPLPVSAYTHFPKCQTIPLKLKDGKVGWCGDWVESLLFLNVSVYKDELCL